MEIVHSILEKGSKCIVMLTTQDPETFKNKMNAFGWDVSKYQDNLHFIDCYSWRLGGSKEKYKINSIQSVDDLNFVLGQAIKDTGIKEGGIILDTLSDLILYGEPKRVFKFVDIFTGKVRQAKSVGLLAMESGMHEAKEFAIIERSTDGTIEMKFEEGKRQLRIKRMTGTDHPAQWVHFDIKHGIEVSVNEFFSVPTA